MPQSMSNLADTDLRHGFERAPRVGGAKKKKEETARRLQYNHVDTLLTPLRRASFDEPIPCEMPIMSTGSLREAGPPCSPPCPKSAEVKRIAVTTRTGHFIILQRGVKHGVMSLCRIDYEDISGREDISGVSV
ncbi:unnamed protein product [Leuciscus chuanchicus]